MNTDRNGYTHAEVRALDWALNSPPLVSGMHGNLPSCQKSDTELLTALDANPRLLVEHLRHCDSHRLGYYFEALWQFYFLHHPHYKLLAHNKQVCDSNGRTLGAFDFIYQYLPSGDIHHLEVAVKFYLYVGEAGEASEQTLWPGPNPSDNLANKVERLRSHQLPLSTSAQGRLAIAESSKKSGAKSTAEQPVYASGALKGYLFLPWRQSITMPEWAPQNVCCGQWLSVDTLPALLDHYANSRWAILQKRHWLGTQQDLHRETQLSAKELVAWINTHLSHYPVMVAQVGNTAEEIRRFFVVPDGWLQQARG